MTTTTVQRTSKYLWNFYLSSCFTTFILLCQGGFCFPTKSRPAFSRHAHRHHATTSSTTNALNDLCSSWDLPQTKSLYLSLQNCPPLVEAIETQDLALWMHRVGRISKERRKRMITHHPLLLARALMSEDIQSIPDILSTRLGLTEKQFQKMASKGSASYRWSRSNVRQLLYLFTDDLQLSSKETIKVLMGYPQLLNYHTSTLQSSVTYFRDEVGLNARRMITRRPMVLTYSVEQQLRPTLEFLKKMKSSNWTGWRRMVESYPQVLQYSVETTWIPKLAFLKTFLQLERSKDAAHIVSSYPPILWLRDELLQKKLDFLETTLQLNKAELRYLVMSFPQLLGLAVDQNLRPKCQFLLETMSLEQLREFCLYQPSLLAYSLEGRLRPRIERMKDNAIYFGYSPPYLMSLSDEKFQQWVDMNASTWSPMKS